MKARLGAHGEVLDWDLSYQKIRELPENLTQLNMSGWLNLVTTPFGRRLVSISPYLPCLLRANFRVATRLRLCLKSLGTGSSEVPMFLGGTHHNM